MKILSIGLDKNLFKPNSEAQKRQIEYGQLSDQLHILVLYPGQEQKISDNVWVYPVGGKNRIIRFYLAYKKAKEIVKRNKINLVSSQDPFFTGLIGWLIKRKFKIPLQIQIHTDFLSPYFWQESFLNKIRVWLAKFLIPKADGIRVVSKRIKNSIISECRNIEISEIVVLPIFVDIKKIQETPIKIDLRKKYPQFDFIILMASRLTKEKNIGLAIEAISDANIQMHANDTNVGLIIVGEGKEKNNLRLQVTSYKLQENVIIEPWTDDLVSYYKTADLFLLTSNYEGYGRTVIEAMAAGCPVIMTEVGCVGEILRDGENGLVVPIDNKTVLSKAIIKILKNSNLRQKFKEKGLETVRNLKTKEQYLADYKKSWEQCLKRC